MAHQATRIGFIGIGNMGNPMAANLVKAGWRLAVYDVDAGKARDFAAAHGTTASANLTELARASDVVVTMLPDGHIVRRVVLGAAADDDALVRGLAKGATVIDMSSSAPVGTRELGKELERYGISLLDAPVSGGVRGAVAATLAIMIGGDEALATKHDDLFGAMGKRFYVGALGSGHAAKVLNNYVSAAGLLAAAEAVHVGERFGIDAHVLIKVINASTGRNNSTENKFEQFILNGKFNAGFTLGLMAKDITLAMEVAQAMNVDAELGHATLALWKKAERALGGSADHTAIAKYVVDSPTSRHKGRDRD